MRRNLGTPRRLQIAAVLAAVAGLAGLPGLPGPLEAESARLRNVTGLAYYYEGRFEDASREFAEAVRRDPDAPEPRFNLGRVLEQLHQLDQALEQYRIALSLDPDYADARLAVQRLGYTVDLPEAPAAPQEAPLDAEALEEDILRLKDLLGEKSFAKAASEAETLLKAHPREGRVHLVLGLARSGAGDPEGAIAALRRAESLLPSSWVPPYHLSRNLYTTGRFEEAQRMAERSAGLAPQDPRPRLQLSRVLRTRGQAQQAYDQLAEASRLSPGNPELSERTEALARRLGLIHYNNGIFHFNQQNWRAARDELRSALRAGNLTPEQQATAQQFLIVAEFSLAGVASQIEALQKERKEREAGYLRGRTGFQQLAEGRLAYPAGTPVDFQGWIVKMLDDRTILITTDPDDLLSTRTDFGQARLDRSPLDFNIGLALGPVGNVDQGSNPRNPVGTPGNNTPGGPVNSPTRIPASLTPGVRPGAGLSSSRVSADFRVNGRMDQWFLARTPEDLPREDPRLAPRSRIQLEGKLSGREYLRNPYSGSFSIRPQPVIQVRNLSARREERSSGGGFRDLREGVEVDTPPGLAGPLTLDFLRTAEMERRNR